jgi:hypothetical protein
VQRYAAQLYRKPTEKELLTMAPKPELIRRWAAFLALPDTGVTRLVPEAGCGENAVVISAAEECLEFTMPGGGSSYSFRAERYRIKHLADITYTNGELRATGLLMHVILVDLGDHPVDELTLASEGLRFLADFEPITDFDAAREVDGQLARGIVSGERVYARSVPVAVNSTYALRSVAYRGKVMRSVRGATYNELDFDRRRDVIVVFRIIDRDADGGITIVWRRLRVADTPKVNIPSRDGAKDPQT